MRWLRRTQTALSHAVVVALFLLAGCQWEGRGDDVDATSGPVAAIPDVETLADGTGHHIDSSSIDIVQRLESDLEDTEPGDASIVSEDAQVPSSSSGGLDTSVEWDASESDESTWPPCSNPKFVDDGKKGGNNGCWKVPEKWCSAGANGAETAACKEDSSLCCDFPSTCVPCDWVSCFECQGTQTCPQACAHRSSPWDGVWNGMDCDQLKWTMKHCVICADQLVCP